MSLLFTVIVTFVASVDVLLVEFHPHFHRHVHNIFFIVTSIQSHRHFLSPSSSLPPLSSLHLPSFTFIYLNRFRSCCLSPSDFLLLISFSVPHIKRTWSQIRHRPSSESKELGARQGTDYISSGNRTESQTRHKSSSASQEFESRQDTAQLISSLNALVRSAGFSLKMQLRLLLLPISSHGSTAATVSSWVHLILSSNLSRKSETLLQDTLTWHPATTTQHLSWKNCTGF